MNPTTTFDFSPLEKLKPSFTYLLWLLFSLFLAFVSFLALGSEGRSFVVFGSVMLASIAAGVKSYQSYRKAIAHNQSVLSEFAAKNNLSYQTGDSTISSIGTIFEEGSDKNRKNIFEGTLEELPFQAYAYYYTTGSGKNRQTHDTMVFEVTLPRVLPQFVIDSQLENVIPIVFDKSQKIELEGDFHKYFDLYAPDTYGVSALTVLAPDVMEVLMEKAALCDIEVIQNKLFFYFPAPATNKSQYEVSFNTVTVAVSKLKKKLVQDDIFATPSQSKIHAQPASTGARLKRSNVGLILGGVIVLYVIMQFALGTTKLRSASGLIIAAFWLGIFGFVFAMGYKQSKLKKEYLQRYDKN